MEISVQYTQICSFSIKWWGESPYFIILHNITNGYLYNIVKKEKKRKDKKEYKGE